MSDNIAEHVINWFNSIPNTDLFFWTEFSNNTIMIEMLMKSDEYISIQMTCNQ